MQEPWSATSHEAIGAPNDEGGPHGAGEFGLITHHLARRIGADAAVLALREPPEGSVEVVAAWGIDRPTAGPVPLQDSVVGRALQARRTLAEPLNGEGDPGLGPPLSGKRLVYAIGAPVRPPGGPDAALCAGFAAVPRDEDAARWMVASYARLAALCLHDGGALDALLAASSHDSLTGCLNHAAIHQELVREIRRCTRSGRAVSCLFIDLDDFKRVNDELGHLHGSGVLTDVATVLRAGVRSGDSVGRYGGDEFVALLPDTDEAAATRLAERLRASIMKARAKGTRDRSGASVGVAQWRPGDSADWMLELADRALRSAKQGGGDAVVRASELRTGARQTSARDRIQMAAAREDPRGLGDGLGA